MTIDKTHYNVLCKVETDIADLIYPSAYDTYVTVDTLLEALEMSTNMKVSLATKQEYLVQGCCLTAYDGIEEVTVKRID